VHDFLEELHFTSFSTEDSKVLAYASSLIRFHNFKEP